MVVELEGIIFKKTDNKIKYLLLKRTKEKGGFWQPVTGRLEKGETKVEALKREIKEETGITDIKRVIKGVHSFGFVKNSHHVKEYVYGVEVSPKREIAIDSNIYPEHSKYKWCGYEEALKLLKWEGNKEGLRQLNKLLTGE